MEQQRKEELSIYYHIKDTVPAHITVVDGYPEHTELVLPSVSVECDLYENLPIELGNREGLKQRTWYIDIFAESKQQRDDLGELVYDALLNNIEVYNFDLGDPPPYPPQIGVLRMKRRASDAIRVFRDLVEKLYWRRRITLITIYQDI